MATAAAASLGVCFLLSTVYHVTSPSRKLAYWTRNLDYFGVYFAIAVSSLADYAIATRSFRNTRVLAIADVPIAAVIVFVFFVVRRVATSSQETWHGQLGGCSLAFGLFRRAHLDLKHAGVRQATSLLLVVAYFVGTPSLFLNFSTTQAVVVLTFQLLALASLVGGMLLDNVFLWPDRAMMSGKFKFLSSKSCGCALNSHAIWHVISVIAAIKSTAGREIGLSFLRL